MQPVRSSERLARLSGKSEVNPQNGHMDYIYIVYVQTDGADKATRSRHLKCNKPIRF